MSLYLILQILFPPLWSDVGRKMLREFHFAGEEKKNSPLKPPFKSNFFLSPSRRDFLSQLAASKKKKNAARALLLNSTAASSRSAHSGADPVPHTNYFSASLLQRYSGVSLSRSFSFFEAVLLGLTGAGARAAQWLCCVPPWAGLGTSRSAIALRPRLRGCVSRARAAEVVGTSSGRKKNKRVGSAASAPHTFYTDKSGSLREDCCCLYLTCNERGG